MLLPGDAERLKAGLKGLADDHFSNLAALFKGRVAACSKLHQLRIAPEGVAARGETSPGMGHSFLTASQRKAPELADELKVLIGEEVARREAERDLARLRARYWPAEADFEFLPDVHLELLQALMTTSCDPTQARHNILSLIGRGENFSDLGMALWSKWAKIPENRVDEVLAEAIRLLDVEFERRGAAG